jgi:NADPH:quinone reductase-like Zn-dependent oxidoreductase
MIAITRTKYGSPDVLEIKEIETPQPKKDEVLVRVHYTTVNRTDCGILTGKPYLIRAFTGLFKPSSLVPGTDFAGEVTAIGKEVKKFKIGFKVWGLNDEGLASHSQFMTIKESKGIVKIPNGFSCKDASACAEGAHYAYNFITKIHLKEGDKVLVNGATGAIGSATVQILKHFGAYVTAVGNTKNLDLLKKLGADKIWNYETQDFTKDTEKYDFICDAVGKSSFGECKPIMKNKSIYISSELGPNSQNLYLPFFTKFSGKRVIFPIPVNCKRSLLFINKLIEKGEFKAVIDKVYPIEEVKDAYKYVMTGQKTGNVLLNFTK